MITQSVKTRLLAKINIFQACLLIWAAFWHIFNHRLVVSLGGFDLSIWSAVLLIVIALTFCRAKAPRSRARALALVLGEFILLTVAAICGPFGPTIMAFIVVAIKAGLLLNSMDLFWVFPLTILLRGLAGEGHDYLVHNLTTNVAAVDYFALIPIWRKARIPFLSALILGTLLFRSLLTEQKAKDRLEELNIELRALELKIERERIARDIHDSLGHSLTSLNIQLDVALHLVAQGKDGVEASLRSAKVLSRQCLVDVRKTLRTIKEPDLEFAAAVRQLAAKCNERGDLSVLVDISEQTFNQAVSHHLFCIVQESLTNALRHAGAKNVTVKQKLDGESLILNIKDDGSGFDVINPGENGSGIMSMKYRAESLGGTFCLSSQPGHGTEITIIVPMRETSINLPGDQGIFAQAQQQ